MANQTYAALKKQQAELEKLIERTKKKEQRGVIKRMVEAIEFYELTAAELGFKDLTHPLKLNGATVKTAKPPADARKSTRQHQKGVPKPIRYRHGEHVWTGMGHTPNWLTELMAQGHDKEEYRVKDEPATTAAKKPPKGAAAKPRASNASADNTPVPGTIYRSTTGKEWDGTGRMPAWIQIQIYGKKATKKLADFAVKS